MTATLEVRPNDQKNTLVTIPNIKWDAGKTYTIIVTGRAKGAPKLRRLKTRRLRPRLLVLLCYVDKKLLGGGGVAFPAQHVRISLASRCERTAAPSRKRDSLRLEQVSESIEISFG
jgi:hypothetical protein